MTMQRTDTVETISGRFTLIGRVIAVQGPAPTDLVKINVGGNVATLTQAEAARRWRVR